MSGRPRLYRRYDLLEVIRKNPRASIQELMDCIGVKSKSQVHGLLKQLEAEGLITRIEGQARSIRITGNRRRTGKAKSSAAPAPKPPTSEAQRLKWERHKMKRQTPAQLQKKIEEVVKNAERKAAAFKDGEQWFLRKDYRHGTKIRTDRKRRNDRADRGRTRRAADEHHADR